MTLAVFSVLGQFETWWTLADVRSIGVATGMLAATVVCGALIDI